MSLRKYSKELVDGPNQAASRSMLRGVGFTTEDFSKPFVGIASTGAKVTPCNMHINKLSEVVESSVNSSGGKGILFNTITVSDGISMGTQGMKYSLISREVIADSIETVVGCLAYDGLIAIGGCDKNMPGCLIGMARLNRPSIFIYGGSIKPSDENTDYVTVLEKSAEERDFLGEDNPPIDTDGNPISISQGVYMSMKVNNFSIEQGADTFISPNQISVTTSGNDCYPGLVYRGDGVFGRRTDPADPTTYVPFEIPSGSKIRLEMRFFRKGTGDGNNKCERREFEYDKEFTASQTYQDIIQWWVGDNIALSLDDDSGWNNGGGTGPGTNTYIGVSATDGGASKNCLSTSSVFYDMSPNIGTNYFAWYQDADDQISFACTGTRACGSSSKKDSKIEMKWTITRADTTVVFETLPTDALPNVWFESSESFPIVQSPSICEFTLSVDTDEPAPIQFDYVDINGVDASIIVAPAETITGVVGACGSMVVSPATPPDDPANITIDSFSLPKCSHIGNVQSQNATRSAIIDTDFYNCFSFGNGVESYRIRDSFEGRTFNEGERVFTTDNEDYRREHRFADITYSGLYNDETNLNNLNQFNLGLLNFLSSVSFLNSLKAEILSL